MPPSFVFPLTTRLVHFFCFGSVLTSPFIGQVIAAHSFVSIYGLEITTVNISVAADVTNRETIENH